jgi:hypothetical protein
MVFADLWLTNFIVNFSQATDGAGRHGLLSRAILQEG